VFNGFSVTGTAEMIQQLAAREEVQSITPDAIDVVPAGRVNLAAASGNITAINAPVLWDLGYYGQGVVVASMDTGVDINHPELAARWRGGSASWYDPYNQHPLTPTDLNGHGTWTTGVMVASDASGESLGVAPQAQWIAVKIFNDSGSATATAIHLGYQWLLDPDGNPATTDAPQVVNNSWTFASPGCNLEFQYDLQALRLAGILPVFAAGNFGPNTSTSASPSNYPEALAIGSVDNSGVLQVSSSRGPSTCGETSSIYPELVAPGANITTTDLYGFYTQASGTSISSPHVAGVLALLLNAFPGITTESQAAALTNTTVDLGSSGPDNDFGYGKVDALAAYNWLAAGNGATPTPVPTATATAIPTATPTPSPTPFIDVIFSDGFESGDLNQWSAAVTDGGRLNVSSQAALVGTQGMQALLNSTRPIYVLDTSPAAEATYHARFYFAPNSISMPKNKTHDVFTGRNSTGNAIFKLQLQVTSGKYQLRGVSLLGNGKTTTTSWYTISNSAHAVEITWQAASTTKGSDGLFSLWVDGLLMQTRSGIANGGYRLEEVLLGPHNIPAGTSGSEYFDAFSSSKTTTIGP
jgi:subtilisin family serine protease